MRENQLQKQAVRYLKKVPDLWFYVVNDRVTSGIPDIVMCHRGRFKAIELKVGKNKPTELQKIQLERIQESGGLVTVAYDLDAVVNFIQNTH